MKYACHDVNDLFNISQIQIDKFEILKHDKYVVTQGTNLRIK